MRGVNKVILVGTIGQDPVARYSPDGKCVVNLSVATNETWKDKNSGETKESTEWHRVVCYGNLAEIAAKYLKKGGHVYFEGKLKTKKWTDQNQIERYTTEIIASELQMLGGKSQDQQSSNGQANAYQQNAYQQQAQQQAPQGSKRQAPPANYQGVMPNQSQGQFNAQGGYGFNNQAGQPSNEPPIDFDDDIPFN